MALRLKVISEHHSLLGEQQSIVIGVGGGSIGRAHDNDWVLPDPQRYLSGHHARVHFRQGAYYLEDLSTNGVFVNGAETPVAKGGAYALHSGDLLRIGDYRIAVTVDTGEDVTPAARASAAANDNGAGLNVENVTRLRAARAGNGAIHEDLGASLNLEELIVTEEESADEFGAIEGYGLSFEVGAGNGAAAPRQAPAAQRISDFRAAVRARRAGRQAVQEAQSGLQSFCRGAGLDPDKLPAEAQARLLQLAGQLLRETVVGLKDLESAQHEFRGVYNVELPPGEDDRLKASDLGVDEFLVKLLNGHERNELDAVMWLRDTLRAVRQHDIATAHALRSAFADFVIRLDPKELESRFKRSERARHSAGGPEEHWDSYREIYRNLTQMPHGHLPHLFVEAFAQAYLEELRGRQEAGK